MGLQRKVTINYKIVYYIDFVIPCIKLCLLQNNITKKEKNLFSAVRLSDGCILDPVKQF